MCNLFMKKKLFKNLLWLTVYIWCIRSLLLKFKIHKNQLKTQVATNGNDQVGGSVEEVDVGVDVVVQSGLRVVWHLERLLERAPAFHLAPDRFHRQRRLSHPLQLEVVLHAVHPGYEVV